MKVKVLQPFYDFKEGVARKVGDTFSCSNERFKKINSTKFGKMVEAVTEETVKPKRNPKRGD